MADAGPWLLLTLKKHAMKICFCSSSAFNWKIDCCCVLTMTLLSSVKRYLVRMQVVNKPGTFLFNWLLGHRCHFAAISAVLLNWKIIGTICFSTLILILICRKCRSHKSRWCVSCSQQSILARKRVSVCTSAGWRIHTRSGDAEEVVEDTNRSRWIQTWQWLVLG